jgi:hypothetical protein
MPEPIRERTLAESLEFLAGDILDHPARHGLGELSILLLALASQAQDLQDRCERAEAEAGAFWERESREAAAGSYGDPAPGWYLASPWTQPGVALPVPPADAPVTTPVEPEGGER